MAKTIEEWFNIVKQPYKKQLLFNTKKRVLKVEVDTLEEAIQCAFVWSESKEGNKYWGDFRNECMFHVEQSS